MSEGLLKFYRTRRTVYEVAMNEVKFLQFGQDRLTSIGTANLNGCSVVIAVSSRSAILAHISPRPTEHASNPNAGDSHVRAKMEIFGELYKANKHYLSPGGSGWVVCAVFQGELALPDQQTIIQDSLIELGLSSSLETYMVETGGHTTSGKGTVFVDGTGTEPSVYVEDVAVSGNTSALSIMASESGSTAASTTSSASGTSPHVANWSGWTWNEAYDCNIRYRQNSAVEGGYEYEYGNVPAESTTSMSQAESSTPVQPSSTGSHYYVRHKKYYFVENGQSFRQPACPLSVWVLNDRGWSESENRSMKWRYYDGENTYFLP